MRTDVKNTMGYIIAHYRQQKRWSEQELAEKIEPRGLIGLPETDNTLSGDDVLNWQYGLAAPPLGQLRSAIKQLEIPSNITPQLFKDWQRVTKADYADVHANKAAELLQKLLSFNKTLNAPDVDNPISRLIPVRRTSGKRALHYQTDLWNKDHQRSIMTWLKEKDYIADEAANDSPEQAKRRQEITGLFSEWDALHEEYQQSQTVVTSARL